MSDPATTVSLAPIVQALAPYALAIAVTVAGIAIKGAVAVAADLGQRWFNYKISADRQASTTAKIEKTFDDLASKAVASASDNLATTSIDVRDKIVADLAAEAQKLIPVELTALGLTPDAVALKVTAAIGRKQVAMTTVSPLPTPAATP